MATAGCLAIVATVVGVILLLATSGSLTDSATPGPVALSQPAVPGAYEPIFAAAAERFGVPESLLLAVGAQESGFNPQAVSSAGAIGLMQMLPATFREWAPAAGFSVDADPRDPAVEIPVATAMLAGDGAVRDPESALFAYNHNHRYVSMVLARAVDYSAWLAGEPRPS